MRAAILAVAATVIVCAIGLAAGERPKPKTHTVTMEKMRFQPESLTVARGDTVVWVNKDLVPHTATSKAAGFDSQVMQLEPIITTTAGVELRLTRPRNDTANNGEAIGATEARLRSSVAG